MGRALAPPMQNNSIRGLEVLPVKMYWPKKCTKSQVLILCAIKMSS